MFFDRHLFAYVLLHSQSLQIQKAAQYDALFHSTRPAHPNSIELGFAYTETEVAAYNYNMHVIQTNLLPAHDKNVLR